MKSHFRIYVAVSVTVIAGLSTLQYFTKKEIVSVKKDLQACLRQVETANAKCMPQTSSVALLGTNVPDRTIGWEKYSDQVYGFSFSHPADWNVSVDPPSYDIIMRRIKIGSAMILESVSDGVSGDSPADYERLVQNAIGGNVQPNWKGFDPGFSSENFGNITLYSFHTNILDTFGSPNNLTPSTSGGLPLQGVIFHLKQPGGWFVYYSDKDAGIAHDILRSIQ